MAKTKRTKVPLPLLYLCRKLNILCLAKLAAQPIKRLCNCPSLRHDDRGMGRGKRGVEYRLELPTICRAVATVENVANFVSWCSLTATCHLPPATCHVPLASLHFHFLSQLQFKCCFVRSSFYSPPLLISFVWSLVSCSSPASGTISTVISH